MVFEISKYLNKKPKIDKTVFIAEGSNVIGSVEIKKIVVCGSTVQFVRM